MKLLIFDHPSLRQACNDIVEAMSTNTPPLCSSADVDEFINNKDKQSETKLNLLISSLSLPENCQKKLINSMKYIMRIAVAIVQCAPAADSIQPDNTMMLVIDYDKEIILLNEWKASCRTALEESLKCSNNGANNGTNNGTITCGIVLKMATLISISIIQLLSSITTQINELHVATSSSSTCFTTSLLYNNIVMYINKISSPQFNSNYSSFWFKWIESVVEVICNHEIMTSCAISVILTHLNTRDANINNANINNSKIETYNSIINANGINIDGLAIFLSFSTEETIKKIFDTLLSRVNKYKISINNSDYDDSNYTLLQILHLCYLSLIWKIVCYSSTTTISATSNSNNLNSNINEYFHNNYNFKKIYNDNIDNVFNEKSPLSSLFIWLYNFIKSSPLGPTLPEIYAELIDAICLHSQQSNEIYNNDNNDNNNDNIDNIKNNNLIVNKLNNIEIFLRDSNIFNILSYQLVSLSNISETNTDTKVLINSLLLQYYNRNINENNNLNINTDELLIIKKKKIINIWKLLMKLSIKLAEKFAILDPSYTSYNNGNEMNYLLSQVVKDSISSLLLAVLDYGGEFFNNLDGKLFILLIIYPYFNFILLKYILFILILLVVNNIMEYSRYLIEDNGFSLESAVNVYSSIIFLKFVHSLLNENNNNNLLKWFFYLISSLSIKSLKIVNFIGIEKRELSLIVNLLSSNNNSIRRINDYNINEFCFYLSMDILKQIQFNYSKNIQLQVNDIVSRLDTSSNRSSNDSSIGNGNIRYIIQYLSIETISNCVINDIIILIHHYNSQCQNIHQMENNDDENSQNRIFDMLLSFITINNNNNNNSNNINNNYNKIIKKQISIIRTLGWSISNCFVSLNILKCINVKKRTRLTFSQYFLELVDNLVKFEERNSFLNYNISSNKNNTNITTFEPSNCQFLMISFLASCLHNSTNLISLSHRTSSFNTDYNKDTDFYNGDDGDDINKIVSMNEQVKHLSSSLSINIISSIRRTIIKKLHSLYELHKTQHLEQATSSNCTSESAISLIITHLDENYEISSLKLKHDIKVIAGNILIKLISLELNSQFPSHIAEKSIKSFISLNLIS
jgi:hypothetical protein